MAGVAAGRPSVVACVCVCMSAPDTRPHHPRRQIIHRPRVAGTGTPYSPRSPIPVYRSFLPVAGLWCISSSPRIILQISLPLGLALFFFSPRVSLLFSVWYSSFSVWYCPFYVWYSPLTVCNTHSLSYSFPFRVRYSHHAVWYSPSLSVILFSPLCLVFPPPCL